MRNAKMGTEMEMELELENAAESEALKATRNDWSLPRLNICVSEAGRSTTKATQRVSTQLDNV